MAGKESARGSTSDTVRANITAVRELQNLNYTQVSERLARSGWTISAVGIRRIESGERRVDVDDLAALAVALGVTPITLLMPPGTGRPDEFVDVTGLANPALARRVWDWLTAQDLPEQGYSDDLLAFYQRALPVWQREEVSNRYRAALKQGRLDAVNDILDSLEAAGPAGQKVADAARQKMQESADGDD
jgi:transcriptional regulator with XRE-family HTH domain